MIQKILLTMFAVTLFAACNPREPKANRLKEEIEEVEEGCCGPKSENYGPIP